MELRPPTERVPARRGVPAAVGVAVLVLLGVLIVKPWEDRSPLPSPVALAPSPSVVRSPLPSPEPSSVPVASPSPTPTLAPLPILDIAPLEPLGEVALNTAPGSAMARCSYGRARGDARRLRAIEVQAPEVMVNQRAAVTDISRVGWRFELGMNMHDRVFDREWETVGQSRMQVTATVEDRPAPFTPLTLRYPGEEMPHTAVFRARVVVEWYTRNLELAGRAEIVANRYQEAGDERIGAWPVCCQGLRAAR